MHYVFVLVTTMLFLAPYAAARAAVEVRGINPGSSTLPETINTLYSSAVGVAGIAALVMIVVGAIYYTISRGSPQKKEQGKEYITSAIWGLVLLLGAYLILNTVNPELVTLSAPGGKFLNITAPTSTAIRSDVDVRVCAERLADCENKIIEVGAGTLDVVPACSPDPITKQSSDPECREGATYPTCGSGVVVGAATCTQGNSLCVRGQPVCVNTTASNSETISIPNCSFAGIGSCKSKWQEWESIEIKSGGEYQKWVYYPRQVDPSLPKNDDHLEETDEYGATCIPWRYRNPPSTEWESTDRDGLTPC